MNWNTPQMTNHQTPKDRAQAGRKRGRGGRKRVERDETMLLVYLQSDRPIRTKVSVGTVEEPEADPQAHHTGDKRTSEQRELCE